MPWIILLQGVALASACFFMLVPSFMAIDSSMEESGRVSGLTQRSVVTRISVPLVLPAILAAAIYFFIIAIEGFDYPAMLGLPSRTFVASTWLFLLIGSSSGVPQYGEAAALGVLMSSLGGSLSLFYFWTTRRAARYAVITGKRRAPDPTALSRRAKWLAWIFIGFYAMLGVFIPLATLIWSSLTPFLRLPSTEALASVSFRSYRMAIETMGESVLNSVLLMVAVPTVSVLFGLSVTWVVTRTRVPGRRLLDFLVMAAVAIPSTVVALAFLFLGIWSYALVPVYGTIWLVILALGVRQTTWAHRAISSASLQVHRELEEAASASGIRRGRVMLSILVPIIRPAILFSWFWIALLALRELAIPLMLLGPETRLLSTSVWTLSANGSSSAASAVGVIMIFVIALMVVVFHRFAGRRLI
jgi:iron(III) transport system permease protein